MGKWMITKNVIFVKANSMKTCGSHVSVLGWHSQKKVIDQAGEEYWVPPSKESELDLLSDSNDDEDSERDNETDGDE